MNIFKEISLFPKTIKLLLVCIFITRTTYFMVWPFITVIFHDSYKFDSFTIGIIMTISSLISVMAGFYAGNLSDKIGRKTIISLGCIFAVLGYLALAISTQLYLSVIGLFLIGLAYSYTEAPCRALISDILNDSTKRELALQIRYFTINVGGAVGPLLGITFGISAHKSTFLITAIAYALFYLIVKFMFYEVINIKYTKIAENHLSIWKAIITIRKDLIYCIAIISGTISYIIYSQIDFTIPQFIIITQHDLAVKVITTVFVANSITVIISQLIFIRILRYTSIEYRIIYGMVLFCLFQLFIYFSNIGNLPYLVLLIAIFSVAEAIIYPNLNIQMDRLAPEKHRGAYLGASSLTILGLSIGPIISGFFLKETIRGVFLVFFLICLMVICLQYLIIKNLKKESRISNEQ
ncbi:MAG TPA: MFS transporter [Burkholderiales bacterium]|nr:MFS transporter [Burkholderiales bacterium]